MECYYCKSKNIIQGIDIDLTAESGHVGLSYRKYIMIGTEPLLADLCKDCGTIIRFYVLNTDKNWVIKKNDAK